MRCETVGRGGCGDQLASVPGQLCPSPRLLGVSINGCRGNVSFEPLQLGLKTFNLLFDTFEFLRSSISVVHNNRKLDRYLIVFDERGHPAEGGLEGREPIRGFFRNVESYLHEIRNPSPLGWEPPGHQ